MATLHKFKLLATQCGVAGSPSRSPTTSSSPVFQIRRRKTLRMLLTRARSARRKPHSPPEEKDPIPKATTTTLQLLISNKLKDLFVSTSPPPPPPPPPLEDDGIRSDETSKSSTVRPGRTGSTGGSHRPLTAVFRYRLLRSRPWRPMLLSIPEYTTAATPTTPGD
ncbi:hypothetical protein Scep_023071 [Stephania cephalantha]|uniref:Uncharacterized protein n=1 Tax=Stephania cephalantha TaxID=152367 RepID=A0AAP0I1D8_9MAGN